jgi:hypothetical protein
MMSRSPTPRATTHAADGVARKAADQRHGEHNSGRRRKIVLMGQAKHLHEIRHRESRSPMTLMLSWSRSKTRDNSGAFEYGWVHGIGSAVASYPAGQFIVGFSVDPAGVFCCWSTNDSPAPPPRYPTGIKTTQYSIDTDQCLAFSAP